MSSLDNVRLKLGRAQEHADTLRAAIDTFRWRHPYDTRAEVNDKADEILVRAIIREQPPVAWGPILGDFVHNLRSALDHLAIALVLQSDPAADAKRSAFPIFTDDPNGPDTPPSAKQAWVRMTHGMTPDHIAAVDAYQPFNYPVNPGKIGTLAALASLSNIDKHRGLIPLAHAGSVLQFVPVDFEGWDITGLEVVQPEGGLEHDAILARFEVTATEDQPKMNVKVHTLIEADVIIDGVAPTDLPISEFLQNASVYVLDLVNDFEAKFFAVG